jgi:hypothetical protein
MRAFVMEMTTAHGKFFREAITRVLDSKTGALRENSGSNKVEG